MIERLILSVIVVGLSALAFMMLRSFHARRASAVAAAAGRGPRLLYFRSDACAPCAAQARYLERLADDYRERVAIEKIDADAEPATAQRYGIFTLPTTLVLDGSGDVKYINYGLTATNKLAGQVEKVL
ncbi:MAG: thioredoxin family protein [Candidatus Promineifilaceae bacterium]|nr:thioredoxin family protein [Candidatus Promineifilaceae bacterium]